MNDVSTDQDFARELVRADNEVRAAIVAARICGRSVEDIHRLVDEAFAECGMFSDIIAASEHRAAALTGTRTPLHVVRPGGEHPAQFGEYGQRAA